MHEILTLNYELNGMSRINDDGSREEIMQGILRQKASLRIKYYLTKLANVIENEVKIFESLKASAKNNEIIELLQSEVDVNIESMWGKDFGVVDLDRIETSENYSVLMKIIGP